MSLRDELYTKVSRVGLLGAIKQGLFDGQSEDQDISELLPKDYLPSSSHTGSDVIKPNSTSFEINPTSDSQGIFFANFAQSVWTSPQNLTGGGHTCGAFGHSVLNSEATLQMALGVEGRIDTLAAGTINEAKAVIGLVVNEAGTMVNAKGFSSELNNSAGRSITNGYGYYADIQQNLGNISKYVGYGMPEITNTGITRKLFLENLDTQAPSVMKAPIAQQDYGYSSPTSGSTVNFPDNISDFSIVPAATLSSLTLSLPLQPLDGQNITFSTTQIVTALTVTSSVGTVMNAPTNLTAGQTIEFKWYGQGLNLWVRKR